MKNFKSIVLLIVSCFLLAAPVMSQVVTNTEALLKIAEEEAIKFQEKRAAAEIYAAEHDIPISFENDKGVFFELQFISEFGIPMYYKTDNRNAAKTVSTDKVFNGGGAGLSLDGTGMTPRQWDGGGVRVAHQEYGGRAVNGDNPSGTHWHSTHVAGTIIASGVQNSAKGMAPNADLRAFDWNSDNSEMASEAANGALISNHSYGFGRGWTWSNGWNWNGTPSISTEEDYLFGFYDTEAKAWDNIAVNAPYYLIVKSAGNDRNEGPNNGQYPKDGPYDCISHGGISKNVMTVGAVHDIPGGWNGPGSVSMSSFSSWGPADDGRVKPDIVANGVGLYSTNDASNTSYTSSDGTSMSAPSATGSMVLLQEHWEELNGSGNYMTAATLKGLVIHTADEAGTHNGPDYKFGWGLMNTKTAALLISEDQNVNVIDEAVLAEGGDFKMILTTDGSEDLKVTICWTDPAGQPVGPQLDPLDVMLVNDLDLKVTKDGNTYYPWKLSRNAPTSAATNNTKNNVDNVEVVFIDSPPAGEYIVTVDHDDNLSGGSQAFSIVVSGVTATVSLPTAAAGSDIESCEDSDVQLNGGSTNSESVLWRTSGDGTFNDPTLLDAVYTLGTNDLVNGEAELTLTAYALPPSTDTIADEMMVTVIFNPIANAGEDMFVCGGGSAQLDGQAEHAESSIWTSKGDGSFDDATKLDAIYTLGPNDVASGQIKLTLVASAAAPCSEDHVDNVFVTVAGTPKPNAGDDGETCGTNAYELQGSAEDNSGVMWSSAGDGSFDDASLLNAKYTPGASDITNGSVVLSMTALAIPPCPTDSTDQMTLTVLDLPSIDAGEDGVACEDIAYPLNATVDNPVSVLWTTTGDGTFADDASMTTTYMPGANDIAAGSTMLTLTADFSGGCAQGYDELQLDIVNKPTADVGPNDSVCKNHFITLTAEATNYSSGSWSSSGDGTWSDQDMLTTDYTPGSGDISAGTVDLTFTANGNGPCTEPANSTMTLLVLGCDAIGEHQLAPLGFAIMPNPADNQFTISSDDIDDKTVMVKVIGIDGKLVYEQSFEVFGSSFKTTIPSTSLAKGVYTIQLQTESKAGNKRLIITR